MDITKKYLKAYLGAFPTIISIAVYYSDKYDVGMANYYCLRENSFFGYPLYLQNFALCSTIVMTEEVILIWLVLLILAIVIDLIVFPIKLFIRRKKNRVEVEENFLYK